MISSYKAEDGWSSASRGRRLDGGPHSWPNKSGPVSTANPRSLSRSRNHSRYARTITRSAGGRRLAGFFVGGVARAPTAVFAQLDPVPVVVPVLLGYVVAPAALRAFKSHVHASISSQGSPRELDQVRGTSIPSPASAYSAASTARRERRAGLRLRPFALSGPQSMCGGGAKAPMGSPAMSTSTSRSLNTELLCPSPA